MHNVALQFKSIILDLLINSLIISHTQLTSLITDMGEKKWLLVMANTHKLSDRYFFPQLHDISKWILLFFLL